MRIEYKFTGTNFVNLKKLGYFGEDFVKILNLGISILNFGISIRSLGISILARIKNVSKNSQFVKSQKFQFGKF